MSGQEGSQRRAVLLGLRAMRVRLASPFARVLLVGVPLAALTSTLTASGQATNWVVPSSASSANQAWLDNLVGPDPYDPEHRHLSLPDDPVIPLAGDPQVLVLPQAGSNVPGRSAATGTPSVTDTSGLTGSGIPIRVLKSYVAAAKQTARIDPSCHLSWSLLAGIGRVETDHGRFGGARVGPDGVVSPPIYGPRLNGTGGFPFVHDTDGGRLDGDPTSDRAVGPMQFLPGTWAGYGTDADGNGVANPQDVDDASLSAARYLCSGGEDLSTHAGQVHAVLRYNHSMTYVATVLALATSYATGQPQPLPVGSTTGPTGSSTPQPQGQPAAQPAATSTSTPTATTTPTPTPKSTPTPTPTPKSTPTPTPTPKSTPTPTPTPTPKPSPSPTPTPKPSPSPTPTPTPTPTPKPTPTPTPTPTPAPTSTPTPTPTPSAKATPSPTPTPSASSKASASPTPTPSASSKASASPTPTPSASSKASATPTPTPTHG